MRINIARAAGLAGIAAGVLALAAGAATPASAATVTDTGGTAVIAISHATLDGLAKAGIVVLPSGSGTASYANGLENITLTVSGGNATIVGATGTLDLAGSLQFVDGSSGKSLTLSKLALSYDAATFTGVAGRHDVTVDVTGSLNGTQNAGPPASQTFTASALVLTKSGAKFLNTALHAKYFKAGQDLGSLATTYDIGS